MMQKLADLSSTFQSGECTREPSPGTFPGTKALIAMSGGVDSSVTAKLMQDAGFECVGCTMKLFDPVEISDRVPGASEAKETGAADANDDVSCGGSDNERDAGAVAEKLGMAFHVADYRADFRRCVIDPFIDDYFNGRTPNPCIECNRSLKFGALLEEAARLGCDYIATGHYARIQKDEKTGKYLLRKGLDLSRDQSYVLYNLTQEQLAHVRLPLGEMHKDEVRALAETNGFINADRPDSQDICFVPDGDYAAVIRRVSGQESLPGDFVDMEGNVMGTHKGIIHYTIGQTRRLGQAFGRPRYVVRIDAAHNRIVLGGPDDVYSTYAKAVRFNWISGEVPESEVRCRVRTRYRQQEQWATVRPVRDAAEIFFDEPQRAITPGQSAVLYDGDIVLGGGIIL